MSGILTPLLVLELGSRIHDRKETEYSAPAVDRALDILEFMAKHPRPYGTTELARCLKIPVNSVFRVLGMSLYTRFELRQRPRPHLEWMCRETRGNLPDPDPARGPDARARHGESRGRLLPVAPSK
jgi:hypothetical protein